MAWDPFNHLILTEFNVETIYNLKEKGLVLSGTITKGTVFLSQQLMMGPDRNRKF
jgi:GTPase